MKYIGKTKVGKVKTNPSTVLAIVGLPVELKDFAGKWTHIWKVDKCTIMIKFSDSKEIEEMPSVHLDVHQAMGNDIEERLRRLEDAVEELRSVVFSGRMHGTSKNKKIAPPPGFEPGTIGLTGRRSTS